MYMAAIGVTYAEKKGRVCSGLCLCAILVYLSKLMTTSNTRNLS